MGLFSFFLKKKKKKQLLNIPSSKANTWGLGKLFLKKNTDHIISELEETLLKSDVSITSTIKILDMFQKKLKTKNISYLDVFKDCLSDSILQQSMELDNNNLNIIFVFGVNGVGKTTSIAKLSNFFKHQNKDVVLAAADTYRAAATDQLKLWAQKIDVPIISHEGKSKPSAVVYDAVESAVKKQRDILLIDTAGRFHNREDLLLELNKLQRIITEKAPNAKVHNILVLDSTTGQNAFEQAKHFHDAVGINGVILSKWDSSGKGGVVITLSLELEIPVFFIGTGESLEDINLFNKELFIQNLM